MAAEAVASAMTDANRMFFMDIPGFEAYGEKLLQQQASSTITAMSGRRDQSGDRP